MQSLNSKMPEYGVLSYLSFPFPIRSPKKSISKATPVLSCVLLLSHRVHKVKRQETQNIFAYIYLRLLKDPRISSMVSGCTWHGAYFPFRQSVPAGDRNNAQRALWTRNPLSLSLRVENSSANKGHHGPTNLDDPIWSSPTSTGEADHFVATEKVP